METAQLKHQKSCITVRTKKRTSGIRVKSGPFAHASNSCTHEKATSRLTYARMAEKDWSPSRPGLHTTSRAFPAQRTVLYKHVGGGRYEDDTLGAQQFQPHESPSSLTGSVPILRCAFPFLINQLHSSVTKRPWNRRPWKCQQASQDSVCH